MYGSRLRLLEDRDDMLIYFIAEKESSTVLDIKSMSAEVVAAAQRAEDLQ
jgi:hypothetical protein